MRLVLGIVGAVVGFYIGGPAGAFQGFSIGYAVGGAIEASNQKIVTEGPRLTDVRQTFSSAGVFIPRVYVRAGGIGGNIIDSTDLIPAEHTVETSEGKGGPTSVQKSTTYSATFRVMICMSDGDRDVVRIKANGNVIFSRHVDEDAEALYANRNLVERIVVYTGADDQLPDPEFEAINGVGNEPGYLGVLSVVFVNFQLEKYSNNIQATQLTFEVVQRPAVQNVMKLLTTGGRQVFDDSGVWSFTNDEFGNTHTYRDLLDGSGRFQVQNFVTADYPIASLVTTVPQGFNGCPPPQYEVQFSRATRFDDVSYGRPGCVFRVENSHIYLAIPFVIRDYQGNILCIGDTKYDEPTAYGFIHFYSPSGLPLATLKRPSLVSGGQRSLQGFRQQFVDTTSNQEDTFDLAANGEGAFAFCQTRLEYSWLDILTTNNGEVVYDDQTFAVGRICGLIEASGSFYALIEKDLIVGSGTTPSTYRYDCLQFSITDGTLLSTWTGPRYAFGRQRHDMFLVGDVLNVVVQGSSKWSWRSDGTLTVSDLAMPSGDVTIVRMQEWQSNSEYIGTAGSVDPSTPGVLAFNTYLFTDTIDPEASTQPLSVVLTDIAADGDQPFTALDFTDLPEDVVQRGYVITRQTSRRVAMDYLLDLYRVHATESGDKIKFVLRGGEPKLELTRDELGVFDGTGDPPETLSFTLADELGLPREVVLKYTDRDNAFVDGAVIARRETTTSTSTTTLDCTAVMLTGTEAAQLVEKALQDVRISSDVFQFSTTYAHEMLEPTDVVTLPGKFKKRRARITKKIDKGGMIEWEAVRDDPNLLTQYVIGSGATSVPGSNAGSIFARLPVTLVDVLNLPLLRNADDDAGFYVFIFPTDVTRWRGAAVYDRALTAPNLIGEVSAGQAPKGLTLDVLPTYGGINAFDTSSSVTVQFGRGTILESVTDERLFGGANYFLIGDEIVGVRSCSALGSDVWQLHGGMLRGQRGTEAAMTSHVAGELVYLLNSRTLRRDRTASASGTVDVNVTVGAVTAGRSLSDLQKYASLGTNTRRALQPFDPVRLAYGEDGQGGLLFKWVRRSRLLFDFGSPAPLGEDTEAYRIDFSATSTFDTVLAFYSNTTTFAMSQQQRMTVPAPFFWRVVQLPSGNGSVPLITPPAGSTSAPAGTMPPDTLPNTVLNINVASVADGGLVVDSSSTPSTIQQAAPVQGGRLVFSDGYTGRLSILDDAKFNFGSRDFSIEIDLIIRSRAGPVGEQSTDGSTVFNHGPTVGIGPGQMQLFFSLNSRGPGYPGGSIGETEDSGTLSLFASDFGSSYGQQVAQSKPHMNDGVRRVFRFARSAGTFYLSVDNVLISAVATSGAGIVDQVGVPLVIGGFKGSIGRITIKTS